MLLLARLQCWIGLHQWHLGERPLVAVIPPRVVEAPGLIIQCMGRRLYGSRHDVCTRCGAKRTVRGSL